MRLVDRDGVEVLDHEECLRLITSRNVGRIGIVDRGQPIILPMNYAMEGDLPAGSSASGGGSTGQRWRSLPGGRATRPPSCSGRPRTRPTSGTCLTAGLPGG